MAERVQVSVTGGVAEVRLARPDKMNALDGAMFQALVDAGASLQRDASVRAVVLSGEGRAFCAGLDFSVFETMASGSGGSGDGGSGSADAVGIFATDGRITHLAQQSAWTWAELRVPVIAAVHGACFGGGIQIALGADLRIVSPDVRMSVLEIRWGLVPDMTGTYTLSRLVGPDVAKELAMTGREVAGEEAVRLGLATRVADDPRAAALDLAREIASKSPGAIRGIKALIDHAAAGAGPAEQFARERQEVARQIGSPNQVEAINAYFAKRDPVYTNLP